MPMFAAVKAEGMTYSPLRRPRRSQDRKSTRLNSSHANISYAVFCLKKKPMKPSVPGMRDRMVRAWTAPRRQAEVLGEEKGPGWDLGEPQREGGAERRLAHRGLWLER